MGRTITLEEVGDRNTYDFLREVSRRQEPLTVILEEGINVTLKAEHSEALPETEEKPLELKPLLTLSGYIPDGWKDAIYDDYH